MTDITGRCRRLHQNQCEGPTTKGLCAKHRAEWEAMTADWDRRAGVTRTPEPKERRASSNRPWTDAELAIVRAHQIPEAVALLDGRSAKAIEKQRQHLGITSRTTWTAEQDQVLRDHGTTEASIILDRPVSVIKSRRSNARIPAPTTGAGSLWTSAEDDVLRTHGIRVAELLLTGRSRGAISQRRTKLGINRASKTTTTQKESA